METKVRARYFYGGLFLVTSSTLMFQIMEIRILSLVSWYYLAFFAISVAMFGLTVGAVWVYLHPRYFSERALCSNLANFSAAFAASMVLVVAVQMSLIVLPVATVASLVSWLILFVCLSIPFFLSGVVVSLALTRSPLPIGRVYGADLFGASLGCLGVLALLNATDAISAVMWVGALAAIAPILFKRAAFGSEIRPLPGMLRLLERPRQLVLVLILVAAANSALDDRLRPMLVKSTFEVPVADGAMVPSYVRWNTYSRVAIFDDRSGAPAMWGPARSFDPDAWRVTERELNIDGHAGTVAYGIGGDVERAGFLKYDVTNLAYYLPDRRSAAVIGVGAGRDMLSARVFGVPEVTGIEVNPIIVRLVATDSRYAPFTGLASLDGMRFEVDEARSWFARHDAAFDVIQMSLIDTWAATGAGAFSLTENGLYTVEAWRIFLEDLSPEGVFTVSRWYSPEDIAQGARLVSLAVATLLDMGVADPARHVVLAGSGRIATLIVARSPLADDHVTVLRRIADELGFAMPVAPDRPPATRLLGDILGAATPASLLDAARQVPLDLSPPTDDRPFFFNQLPVHDPIGLLRTLSAPTSQGAVYRGNLKATSTLVAILLISLLLVRLTIIVPLSSTIAGVYRRLVRWGSAYFLLIGIGFMLTEIALLQRLSVFLGHPAYALSVVLFSIILWAGFGSLASEKLPLDDPWRFAVWAAATGSYLMTLPLWLPDATLALEHAPLLVRAAIAVLAIAPGALLMGWGFPTGMRLVSAIDPAPTPWFWGINGAAGVLAASLAVAISIAFGISVTLIVGGLCYLLLLAPALALRSGARRGQLARAKVG